MQIKPGIGIGSIKFGISESNLIELLGEPDFIDVEEYIEGKGDWHRVLWYIALNLNFTFDKEDGFRLRLISVVGYNHHLYGRDLFGLSKEVVRAYLSKRSEEIPKYENWSSDDSGQLECIDYDSLGMMIWFESNVLTKIESSYLFADDGETILWPL
jgi:hypothetical protein